jgi:hypothetical protein
VACRQHILADTICIVAPFVEAGARVRLAPCNPDSTDDRTVAHLASIGVEVRARAGMSAGELDESLAWLVSEPADALCDMGGDLIAAAAAAGHRPAGALEATTTGLHRLEGLEIPFPVLDWNGIALKDLIHNRHHVGVETWPPSRPSRGWRCTGVRSSWSGSGQWARASPLVPAISAPSSPSSISIRCGSSRHSTTGAVSPRWPPPSAQRA